MRISGWSSDVCSSDLGDRGARAVDQQRAGAARLRGNHQVVKIVADEGRLGAPRDGGLACAEVADVAGALDGEFAGVGQNEAAEARLLFTDREILRRQRLAGVDGEGADAGRSEEHTSELQSLLRHSYPVFCLKKKRRTRR